MNNFWKRASFFIFVITLSSLTRVTRSSAAEENDTDQEKKLQQEDTLNKQAEVGESSKNDAVPSGSASIHKIQSTIDPSQNTKPQETDAANDKSKKNEAADTTQPSSPQLLKNNSVKKTVIPQNILDFLNKPEFPQEDRLDTELPQKGQGNGNVMNKITEEYVQPGVPQNDGSVNEISQKDQENRFELSQNDQQNEETENNITLERDLTFKEVFEEYHRYIPYMIQREKVEGFDTFFFPAYGLKTQRVFPDNLQSYTSTKSMQDFIQGRKISHDDFKRHYFYDWSFEVSRKGKRLIAACPEEKERTIEFNAGKSKETMNPEQFDKPFNVIEDAFSSDEDDKSPSSPSSPRRSNSKKDEPTNETQSDQSPNQSNTETPPSPSKTTQSSNPLILESTDSRPEIASSSPNPLNSASADLPLTMQSPARSDHASSNSISEVALSRNPSNSASVDLPPTLQSPARSDSVVEDSSPVVQSPPRTSSASADKSSKLAKSPTMPNSPKDKKSKRTISENLSSARKYLISSIWPQDKKNDSKDQKNNKTKPQVRPRPPLRPQPPPPPPPKKNKFKGRVLKAGRAIKKKEYEASRFPCAIPLEPTFVKDESFLSVDIFFAGYMIDFKHENKVTPMLANIMAVAEISKTMVWFPVAHLMRHKDTKDTYAIFNHAPSYEHGAGMTHVPIYTDYTIDENDHAFGKAGYYDQMYSTENQTSVFGAIPDGLKYFDPENSLKLVPQELMDQKSVLPMSFKRVALNYMNIAPMFQQIRDKTWRNIENVVLKLPMVSGDSVVMFITGVYGEFKINDTPVYLDNGSNDDGMKRIKVPYAFYKVVNIVYTSPKINAFFPESRMFSFSIVIFTHNDPFEENPEKICDKPVSCELYGWTKVVQDKPAFGFTYCCKFTKKLADKLEIYQIYQSIKHQYLLDLRLLWYVEENKSTNSLAIDDNPPLLVKNVEYNIDLSEIPSTPSTN